MAQLFAYGSLGHDRGGAPARLEGRRRAWGVAMDNRVIIPGYKVWLDPRDGRRPAVHVLFLDLEEAPGHAVDGVLLPVVPEELPALDLRERNYVRDDVAAGLRPAAGGRGAGARLRGEPGRARALPRRPGAGRRRRRPGLPRRGHRGVRGGDPAAAGAGAGPRAARRAAASATSEPMTRLASSASGCHWTPSA